MDESGATSEAKGRAVFGGGCFWCLEAVFERLRGVFSVTSGYAGGHLDDPTYEEVSTGTTGHAEVCRIEFDPEVISYEDLLHVFFEIHDPTTRNRQGNDVGPQYRSIVLTTDDSQMETAKRLLRELDASGEHASPLVTEVVPLRRFWPAEDFHQDYYAQNPYQGYCRIVISPKVAKFEKEFRKRLKPGH